LGKNARRLDKGKSKAWRECSCVSLSPLITNRGLCRGDALLIKLFSAKDDHDLLGWRPTQFL